MGQGLSHTALQAHTPTCTHTHTHTHAHTHTHTLPCIYPHTHTHTLPRIYPHTLYGLLPIICPHTHTHTHTHTHKHHPRTPSLYPDLPSEPGSADRAMNESPVTLRLNWKSFSIPAIHQLRVHRHNQQIA